MKTYQDGDQDFNFGTLRTVVYQIIPKKIVQKSEKFYFFTW